MFGILNPEILNLELWFGIRICKFPRYRYRDRDPAGLYSTVTLIKVQAAPAGPWKFFDLGFKRNKSSSKRAS
jgi:hypothetical protein